MTAPLSPLRDIYANDQSIVKSGTWWVNGTPTAHTDEIGASAELTFEGTGVEVQVFPNADRGRTRVIIDEEDQGEFDGPIDGSALTTYFETHGLSFDKHTIRLQHVGPRLDGGGRLTAFVKCVVESDTKTKQVVRADDRSIVKSGNWWVNGTPTAHTDVVGASAELSFEGTGVEVQVFPNADRGRTRVIIDEEDYGEFDGPTDGSALTTYFGAYDLPAGPHTIRLRHVGPRLDGGGRLTAFVQILALELYAPQTALVLTSSCDPMDHLHRMLTFSNVSGTVVLTMRVTATETAPDDFWRSLMDCAQILKRIQLVILLPDGSTVVKFQVGSTFGELFPSAF